MSFLESIKGGKWFYVKGKHGGKYAVKMGISKHDDETIHSVWISANDPEAMSVEDYSKNDWKYHDDAVFEVFGAGVYHFGSFEAEGDDYIYDEKGDVVVDKMVHAAVNNTEKDFVTKEEIIYMWERLSDGGIDLPELKIKP